MRIASSRVVDGDLCGCEMRTRLKNVAILVMVLVFMPIAWVTVYTGPGEYCVSFLEAI